MTWRNASAATALMASFCVPGVMPAQKPFTNRATTRVIPAPEKPESDDKAIRLAADAYSEAVTKGDLKRILEQWTPHGEYRNNFGVTLEGKAAIEATYKKWLVDHPKAKLSVGVDRIRLISKDAAWVEGTIQLAMADGGKSRSRFRTLRVREDGVWRIAESIETIQTGPQLEDLDWLKGTWKGKAGDEEAEFVVEPALAGAFLKVNFTRKSKGVVLQQGFQMVGADPKGQGLIASVFEANGAMGTGTWDHDGHHFEVAMWGVDRAGLDASAIQVITPLTANTMTWQAIDRFVGGVKLSDTIPLKLTKSK